MNPTRANQKEGTTHITQEISPFYFSQTRRRTAHQYNKKNKWVDAPGETTPTHTPCITQIQNTWPLDHK
jgi:hypothetical protein